MPSSAPPPPPECHKKLECESAGGKSKFQVELNAEIVSDDTIRDVVFSWDGVTDPIFRAKKCTKAPSFDQDKDGYMYMVCEDWFDDGNQQPYSFYLPENLLSFQEGKALVVAQNSSLKQKSVVYELHCEARP